MHKVWANFAKNEISGKSNVYLHWNITNIKTSDTCNVEKHLKNAMMTPVWPYVGLGVILKILNFLGFPGNFIFCKTGPKVFAYFTGVLSHYWGIIIHQNKPTSIGYQEVKGFGDPSTYSWEKGYFTFLRNFGKHCTSEGISVILSDILS